MAKFLVAFIVLFLSTDSFGQIFVKDVRVQKTNIKPTKPTQLKILNPKITSVKTKDPVFIDFVGSGDIQKSLSEGKAINANTGIGIIFERFSGEDKIVQSFELEGIINIATTADTIIAKMENGLMINRRSFGTYLLNPVSAKQSLFINTNIYFGYPGRFQFVSKIISGVNLRVISSNNTWRSDSVSYSDLGALSFRGGVFHEFIPDNYRLTKEGRSKYSLFLGANYIYKGVFGDIVASSRDDLREKLLGTKRKSFNGFEVNFGFRLNNLRAEFQMPLIKEKKGEVQGLTNTQFQFSIRFIGGFSLMLKKNTDSDDDEEENDDDDESETPEAR